MMFKVMKERFNVMKDWFMDRQREQTTYDGYVILCISVGVLVAAPFIEWLAFGGIVYGFWAVVTAD